MPLLNGVKLPLADKVVKIPENFTEDNLVLFDINGEIKDSSKSLTDLATAEQGAKADSAYQKPAEGIPSTDLSAEVQELLDTVDELGDISDVYYLPEDGIPKTDLADDVQASLDKADTALQADDLNGVALMPTYDSTDYKLTFTSVDNTTLEVNLPIEFLIKDVEYLSATKEIQFTKQDETTFTVPVVDLVDDYTGSNGTNIQVVVDSNNEITAVLKNGTITEEQLTTALLEKIDGKYNKPDTGIPATDLSAEVQTTLAKADTALQASDIEDITDNTTQLFENTEAAADVLEALATELTATAGSLTKTFTTTYSGTSTFTPSATLNSIIYVCVIKPKTLEYADYTLNNETKAITINSALDVGDTIEIQYIDVAPLVSKFTELADALIGQG